ncbi:hypothetical protein BDZ89DRAFT_1150008 [Hymenopellis radicata]|nr:hypothetical protein BDZ89DRAFT_1150008 [Hymenopellis radicata]
MSTSTEGQCDKHTTSNIAFFYPGHDRTDGLDALEVEDLDPWKTYRFEDADGDLAEAWRRAVEWQCLSLEATEVFCPSH